jgi:hypothetical protein
MRTVWHFPGEVAENATVFIEVRRPWWWRWRAVGHEPSGVGSRLMFHVSEGGRMRGFLLRSSPSWEGMMVHGYEGNLWEVRLRIETPFTQE